MRIIGLTGGVGTGKSTVACILEQHGIPVADADQMARQALAVGSPIRERVLERYGKVIQTPSGDLDRRRLGQIVFADAAERAWLEAQIHPFVRAQLQDFLSALAEQSSKVHGVPLEEEPASQKRSGVGFSSGQGSQTVCLMIPLLFEAHLQGWVNEIWVVTCTPEQQRQRLARRDPLTPEEIEARIASQWPLAEKVRRADVVLDNSGSLAELEAQVKQALALERPFASPRQAGYSDG
ncbi:dephospho-CoA kinase [Synechococcus sp. R8-2]|uniref:dephospho-CoA kinase n=1 Tax=Synechococcus sp. R8-2 TaxID=2291959 RepID=UPI0039C11833